MSGLTATQTTEKARHQVLWDLYQKGVEYQDSIGLRSNLDTYVRFFEGKQWAEPTKDTKNLPRPVVNIVKMICRAKKSAILSTPVRLVYSADLSDQAVEKFNHFSEYILKEIDIESLDKDAIDDAVKKGTYVYHFYWDSEAKGLKGIKEGGLRCEIIDPLNVLFANPVEKDEQKQKWIMIVSREDVESIKAKADKGVDLSLITSDEEERKTYDSKEQDDNKLVTVLTRYFRENGEVFCEKSVKGTMINKAFSITPPDISTVTTEGEEDAPNNATPDKPAAESINDDAKAYYYPVVVGNYERKERCIYGLGEIEGLIPNQKIINFTLGMIALNVQETAWGKYIARDGALRGQKITNTPGQVLTDYSNTGDGIKALNVPPMNAQALTLIDDMTSMSRMVTGSTEVMTGEVLGANMSGAAIAQLQAQAAVPVEELRDAFWLVKKKQANVLAQFYKLFYERKAFSYEQDEKQPDGKMKKTRKRDEFNGSEYKDADFSVVVETCGGTKASAAGDINILELLLSKGFIDVKTFLETYPTDALSNKTDLIKHVEEAEQSEMAMLRIENEQLKLQLQQGAQLLQQTQDTVNKAVAAIQDNSRLKEQLVQMYSEFAKKIEQANLEIAAGNEKIKETTADAAEFAGIIDQSLKLSEKSQKE